jgi:hypothetical protein
MLNRVILLLIIGLGTLFNIHPEETIFDSQNDLIEFNASTPDPFKVTFFPVAPYYVGDILSIEVAYTGPNEIGGEQILLSTPSAPDRVLGTSTFSSFSQEAVFSWVVDTTGFQPGFYPFLFTIPNINLSWTAGVNLLPEKPGEKPEWKSVETDCCIIHYMTGTEAAEDIDEIQDLLETEVDSALSQFFPSGKPETDPFAEPLRIALIPSVVGHGGFATDIAVLTYTDRNWTGIEFGILAHHEIVHVIDRHLNPGSRPSLFAEGLAVYFSGGHYHKGDALERGAALIETGLYLPLTDITDQFYDAQHEIAYMEAGALIAYLVQTWGWDQFIDFYFNLPEDGSDSEIISSALKQQFGMDFADLEAAFIAYLETIQPGQDVISDVQITVKAYDTIRRYQSIAIPSAHFQSAWWPSIERMFESSIVGDYAPREKSPFNILIESLLIEVHLSLINQDYDTVEENLERINGYLTAVDSAESPPSLYSLGIPLPVLIPRQKLPQRIFP